MIKKIQQREPFDFSANFKEIFCTSPLFKILIIPFLLLSINSYSQKIEWINVIGGPNIQFPRSMSVDESGNQCAGFEFSGQIKFDTITLNSYTSKKQCLVIKQNQEGKLLWYKTICSINKTGNCYMPISIFKKNGNVIVFCISSSDIVVGSNIVTRIGSTIGTNTLFLIEFDQSGNVVTIDYSILYLFDKSDFLDFQNTTFVQGTDHPIKKRINIQKIGDRLLFNSTKLGVSLCVHDIVRKEIKKEGCTGLYFYKIHTAGRLS